MFCLILKDIKVLLGRTGTFVQSILLGLVLVFLFSLARPVGDVFSETYASTVFWIASIFSMILIFNSLYLLEQENDMQSALLLSPLTAEKIWLAKSISGFVALLLLQIVLFISTLVFLDQKQINFSFYFLLFFILIDVGLVLIGSLLGALSYGHEIKESFLSLVIFPLTVPVLLAGIKLGGCVWGDMIDISGWFKIVLAFDCMYLGIGYILFPFVFKT
ncbi:MAG: heme exporter protein CcmB [Desulfonauticus sp.]|nr:heme exporter protein CcmB [Desulfonauticus sp.]